jgi:large subunit ribosomal protein L30
MADTKKIRVKLVRSPIGSKQSHRSTVLGLGLRRMNQVVEVLDTPETRGMIDTVRYLVRVEA